MSEFGVSPDLSAEALAKAEHLKQVRDRQQFEIEAAKETLAPWLRESRDDFVESRTKIVAMMEIAFGHYLDCHDEQGALDMIQRHFRRIVEKRKAVR